MYFSDRQLAGKKLAKKLYQDFKYEDCVVIALNPGGVLIGSPIAQVLCAPLLMLLAEEIFLPREPVSIGAIASDGNFILNDEMISDESSEIFQEYRSVIEEEKIAKIREMSNMIGKNSLINPALIKFRNVIVVSDGLKGNLLLKLIYEFLKPYKIQQFIVATPMANIKAVDWIHAHADKIVCLSINGDDFEVDRYYDNNEIPPIEKIIEIIENIVLNWKIN